jgi:hypothetical protein
MKFTKILLAMAAAMLTVGLNAKVQSGNPIQTISVYTNTSGGLTYVTNTVAVTTSGWQPILNIYDNLLGATNIAVAPFVLGLTSGDKGGTWGGGVLALYNVNNYVGIGIGMYYLAEWYEFNGSVQLQYPMPLWSGFVLTPFVVAGIGTSFAGAGSANGDVDVVSQLGVNLDIVNLGKGWEFGLGGFFGNITGAGPYSGNDAGGFINFHRGF